MSLQVKNITKQYGDQKALDNISFSIPNGQIVGFLGPNGAGKSTLMKILTTYVHSDSGQALVNDFDVETQARNVQKSIGYLPEHNPLYLDMYIREYLKFNADIYKVKKERIEEVIELTGLTPEAHKKIGQLSKGYRQRVGLATALLHDPEVLILDEPTTGLDPNQLVEIRELIKSIGKNKTVFLSTHIMQEVEAICERVIIINKGKIVADQILTSLLEQQNEQVIAVEFDFKIEIQFINRIPDLIQANHIHDTQWELVFPVGKDYRTTVYDFASDNGLKTLSMQVKNKNLEGLFREITQQ
ncbi:gliding motility-associated ABC transporter ATP-binding subunit GldA [Myroides pelagicus]|uniref:Gliding motility-associated ABC transporter ATP-binding subunit GldA n=1 Tax=Myroides pelagicus TaxID=270914 RepID=A0A7K1GML1_9FLAO|nr:gliding motility-associated ABC transporter ATP-binding subunit GldA [Myroides pelagicus]MTH30127.1 gliding motility-associated ABC transporter ATP-binding subunit GldA [Myroides pelagicus]